MITFEAFRRFKSFIARNQLFLLFILTYFTFVTYFLRGISSLDPDFGWRLKFGQIVIDSGIPKTDPFSYTMPSFPFVDHSWLFSVFAALTYPVFANILLSLLLAFAIFTAVILSNKRLKESDFGHCNLNFRWERWVHPMTLAVLTFLLLFFAVRAQIVSWLIFSFLMLILFTKDYYFRFKYFLPVVFLVWANFHGGYSIGLFILGYFLAFRYLINKKGSWKDVLVLFLCIAATLVTPYGLAGWREVASSVLDSRLRYTIAEWMPSVTFFDLSMIFYISMSTFMVFYKRREIPKIQFYLFWALFIFALSSRRNMPYFMLYSLPLTVVAVEKLYQEVKDKSVGRERFSIAFNFLRIFAVILLFGQLYFSYWRAYTQRGVPSRGGGFYPESAVSFLKSENLSDETFSSYGWGGYLIWKLPGKRIFVDGRMPSWKFNPADSSRETTSAYSDYLNIENGELDFNSQANKYSIGHVLWPVEKPSFFGSLGKKARKLFTTSEKADFSFTKYLLENGWKIIYSDETSVVYKRIDKSTW